MNTRHLQHLYWRAGFGLGPKELLKLSAYSKTEIIEQLFMSSKDVKPLLIDFNNKYKGLSWKKLKENPMLREEFLAYNREKKSSYNNIWFNRLVSGDTLFRERMTLFWSNHFVTSDSYVKHIERFNNTLREHALGNFGDFAKIISREASMIKYLNLTQNKKEHPNENFARELLELFTLGIGNYSEKDIKESSRAFTGHSFSFDGTFKFLKSKHDNGKKTFLGKTGNFNGDDIIDIILSKKACAKFICTKIYRYFVNENLNQSHISKMTAVFFKDYNIEKLMRYVFTSDWFYAPENIGSKIKSPIELLVGIQKIIPIHFNTPKEFMRLQNILDQQLLFPPNVAGWHGGRHWINANTMMLRIKLPSMLLENETYSLQPRGNFTKTFKFNFVKNKYQEKLNTRVDWKKYKKSRKKISSEELFRTLILCEPTPGTKAYVKRLGRLTKKKNLSRLMALPEYQLC